MSVLSTTTISSSSSKLNSDELFYEHLTLGLLKVLATVPRVTAVNYEKRQPCERSQITTWEQRHNVCLTDDMRKFYLSTDGFVLTWCYQYSPTDVRRVGQIFVPQLLKIVLLREHMENLVNATPDLQSTNKPHHNDPNCHQNFTPTITSRSKVFELSSIIGIAKVCIVYESSDIQNPKIYLLEMNSLKWNFLAESFSEYLRMAIAHLGLPYWELCFSSCGLPSWAEQLFLLIAPHLLEKNEPRRGRTIPNEQEIPPYNQLDPTVFRTKPRCTRQVPKGR